MRLIALDLVKSRKGTVVSTCDQCSWSHHAHIPSELNERERRNRKDRSRKVAIYHVRSTGHSVTTRDLVVTNTRPQ